MRIFNSEDPSHYVTGLAMLDTQSLSTFIDQKVLTALDVPQHKVHPVTYSLTTLDRLQTKVDTQLVQGLSVQALQAHKPAIRLPDALVHHGLPDASGDVGSISQVLSFPHIAHLAQDFPKSQDGLETLILIGVDCGEAMTLKVHGETHPWVYESPLGMALVGPGAPGTPPNASATRAYRSTSCRVLPPLNPGYTDPDKIFERKPDDELLGKSKEDSDFEHIVASGIRVTETNKIEIPLPLKDAPLPPKNASAVYNRSHATLEKLKREPAKLADCVSIIDGYVKKGHVYELKPGSHDSHTFIPVFPVYNENKGKTRLVFDSSARYKGVSLNQCLNQGPDYANSLLGVLLRFRKEPVAISADIEHMFHCLSVPEKDRKYQCFYWFAGNDPKRGLTPWVAAVHVFGHTSSPAVATYGLRFAAAQNTDPAYENARTYIHRNFYIDDGLRSESTVEQAIDTLTKAREILQDKGMRLHKIVSSHPEVLKAFPPQEIAKDADFKDINDATPQSALGVRWHIRSDEFTLKCHPKTSAFTRRGILSVIGSVYDPKGVAAPFTLQGKLIQRRILAECQQDGCHWDKPLSDSFREIWDSWTRDLRSLNDLSIPRCFKPRHFGDPSRIELHVFCDASAEAIGHVIYLRQINAADEVAVAFVLGSSKVAPKGTSSIPRLELCAALNATLATSRVIDEIDLEIDQVYYYTDSKVVLGYLSNRERRFSRYVTARIDGILGLSSIEQWHYVVTDLNPADLATKPQSPAALKQSRWLKGPDALHVPGELIVTAGYTQASNFADLPDQIKQEVSLSTKVRRSNDTLEYLLRYEDFEKSIKLTSLILRFVNRCRKTPRNDEETRTSAIDFLVRATQQQAFPAEYSALLRSAANDPALPDSSPLAPLCPFLDKSTKIIRVGGRLKRSDFQYVEVHPTLLPSDSPLTRAIVAHEHVRARHQGRKVTAAVIRQAGYHVLHCSAVIRKFIGSCVTCQKLRGRTSTQMMADLPKKRLEQTAPFQNSGVDCFGPFFITRGRDTRKSTAKKKIWVVIFTCLYSRAVHLETILSMDTPTFLLAFRRFEAKRGKCKYLLSDHGSNFLGASRTKDELQAQDELLSAVKANDLQWEFIPPNAPHFAGVWERKIAPIKSALAGSLELTSHRPLAEDEFVTLLEEAASIANKTPLSEVPSDPNEPFPPSPDMLLTLREHNSDATRSVSNDDLVQYGRHRWKRVQALADHFWTAWKSDFISHLASRSKWTRTRKNISEGDVVLIKQQTPRNQWPMAVVDHTHKSQDGLVRSATLRLPPLKQGTPRLRDRPIHSLVLLIPSNDPVTTSPTNAANSSGRVSRAR